MNDQVAAEIRAWMGRRRINQAALGRALSENEMWVSRRLRGRQPITISDLQRFAEALGVEVADLIPRAVRTATGGNTLRNPRRGDRPNPIVSAPPADQPKVAPDRPTPATSRPPRGPRRAHTTPGNRRPAVLPRPAAA